MIQFYCFPSFVRVLLVDLNVYLGRLWSPLWNFDVAGRAFCGAAGGYGCRGGEPSVRSGCVLLSGVCCLLFAVSCCLLCCAVLPFVLAPPVLPVCRRG